MPLAAARSSLSRRRTFRPSPPSVQPAPRARAARARRAGEARREARRTTRDADGPGDDDADDARDDHRSGRRPDRHDPGPHARRDRRHDASPPRCPPRRRRRRSCRRPPPPPGTPTATAPPATTTAPAPPPSTGTTPAPPPSATTPTPPPVSLPPADGRHARRPTPRRHRPLRLTRPRRRPPTSSALGCRAAQAAATSPMTFRRRSSALIANARVSAIEVAEQLDVSSSVAHGGLSTPVGDRRRPRRACAGSPRS